MNDATKRSEEDQKLINLSLGGDKNAYQQLIEHYKGKIFSLAYSVLNNREDAEDVVQESFVKAYLSLNNFQGKSSFYTWLYKITFHMAIDYKRKIDRKGAGAKNKVELDDSNLTHAVELNQQESPQDLVLRRERALRIQNAINSLSPEHRAVITLREVDGFDYDKIAEVTGLNKGTVMSRLHYARKKLQEVLADDFEAESLRVQNLSQIEQTKAKGLVLS